ncbi:pancreatic lipase-related protein 2-like [Centruroides vittatus]|uniref:pancreatic lipase-related protein 2-like n=1 Tax=Centruroides vittatus TaxID=120091 RepID=UPI00350FC3A8
MQCYYMRFSLLFVLIYLPLLFSYNEDNIDKDITFFLYTRDNRHSEVLRTNVTDLNTTNFDGNRSTKILIHGYLDDVRKSSSWMTIRQELLFRGDYNVIIVDWFRVSLNFYPELLYDLELIGKKIADLIKYLKEYGGAKFEDFHLIGQSLGAQISGYVGNNIFKLGRITGLDPAGPKFQNVSNYQHLERSDANFVDVIHTDIANDVLVGFGTAEVVGHADFYPNGGNNHANCGFRNMFRQTSVRNFFRQMFCDHLTSLAYFTQSIRKCSFVGIKCSDWKSFKNGHCGDCRDDGNCAIMGYDLNPKQIDFGSEKNIFYLKTTEYSPYCSYQYQISLIFSQSKNSSIKVSGMYIHLSGNEGELFTALITGFATLRSDAEQTYLVISENNLGDIEKLTFLWLDDSYGYLRERRRRRKKRLHLQEIHVSPLQLSNNEKKHYCRINKKGISSNKEEIFQAC